MNQNSPIWISLLIGFSAFLFAVLSDCWLHYKWFDWESGGWGSWAYNQGDAKYHQLQHLFFISEYAASGIIAGAVAGLGPMERDKRWIRFACGPVLLCLCWTFFATDITNRVSFLLIYSLTAIAAFLAAAYLYGRILNLLAAKVPRR
ncbi:MAG: hypothetical protein ACRYFS_04450 [Janthinobacterium lividum]